LDLYGPDFSDSRDPIFSGFRDLNRVPKMPLKNPELLYMCLA